MRYFLIVSYNGLNYNGFQKQNHKNTIQDTLEQAIKTYTKKEVTCIGSGRTDAKVSAYFQPVHFDIDQVLNKDKFIYSLNGILPEDIKVLDMFKSNLHARFDAKNKTYVYKMYVSSMPLPLFKDALQISPNLDFKSMKKFLKLLIGSHDFSGFKSSGGETENNVRTIYLAKLKRENGYLNFYITGNGFLYKMVRNIVGTMLKIGERKIDLNEIKKDFKNFKSTTTAKPDFLYLYKVNY